MQRSFENSSGDINWPEAGPVLYISQEVILHTKEDWSDLQEEPQDGGNRDFGQWAEQKYLLGIN